MEVETGEEKFAVLYFSLEIERDSVLEVLASNLKFALVPVPQQDSS